MVLFDAQAPSPRVQEYAPQFSLAARRPLDDFIQMTKVSFGKRLALVAD